MESTKQDWNQDSLRGRHRSVERPGSSIDRLALLAGLLLVLVGISYPVPASAGDGVWSPSPIEGGFIFSVVGSPDLATLYACGHGGVFHSADGGATWSSRSEGLLAIGARPDSVRLVAVDPTSSSTVYSYIREEGLYKSTDSGVTWTFLDALTADDETAVRLSAIAVAASAPSTIFAGGSSGLFRSSDGGATWTSLNDVLTTQQGSDFRPTSIAVDPLDANLVLVTNGTEVHRSESSGASWLLLNEGMVEGESASFDELVIDPLSPDVLYAGGSSGLFKSSDGGVSWQSLTAGVDLATNGAHFVQVLNIGANGTGRLVAVVDGPDLTPAQRQIIRSDDGGASWTGIGSPLTSSRVQALVVGSPDTDRLRAATTSGLYGSDDGGNSWSERNRGLRSVALYRLLPVPGAETLEEAVIYGYSRGVGVFRSRDGGESWERGDRGLANRSVTGFSFAPSDPNVLYASDGSQFSKSVDAGETWASDIADTMPFSELSSIDHVVVHPTDPDVVVAGMFAIELDQPATAAFRSVDGGQTWLPILDVAPSESFVVVFVTDVAFDPYNPDHLFMNLRVDSEDHVILRSTDGGDSWEEVLTGVGFGTFAFTADAVYLTSTSRGQLGIYKGTDGGASWALASAGLPPNEGVLGPVAIDPADDRFLVAFVDDGLYYSADAAASWRRFDETGDADPALPVAWLRPGGEAQNPTLIAGSLGGVSSYTAGSCVAKDDVLCIDRRAGDRRFSVDMTWHLGGAPEVADVIDLESLGIDQGGVLWFFDPKNPEVLVKILDGCDINDHFWLFYAATTDVGFELRARDTLGDLEVMTTNASGTTADAVTDTAAFASCDVGGDASEGSLGLAATTSIVEGTWEAGPAPGRSGEGPCVEDATRLCIDDQEDDGRFSVRLEWSSGANGGSATPISLEPLGVTRGGILWFFDPKNPEVLIKVLNGCAINDHYWVFFAATTDVGFMLTVDDTLAEQQIVFSNPEGSAAQTVTLTQAFATCWD